MAGCCGKWLTIEDYAEASGISGDEARERVRSEGLMTKASAGKDYVWVEDPEGPGEAGGTGEKGPEASGPEGAGGPEGEALVARFSGAQELAHQAERAITIVERSMGTFMMMHQEVVKEKERFIDLSREGVMEREQNISEMNERIEELEQSLRDKEQELADLKMLVEIL